MSVGEKTTCYVDALGKMFSWGTHNDFGQLGTKMKANHPQLISDLENSKAN